MSTRHLILNLTHTFRKFLGEAHPESENGWNGMRKSVVLKMF